MQKDARKAVQSYVDDKNIPEEDYEPYSAFMVGSGLDIPFRWETYDETRKGS